MNNKRGISPLIASVLMIAFAVILFLIISSWVQRSVVDEALDKGEEQVANALDCINTRINIVSACAEADNTGVTVVVDNEGDTTITGLKLRVTGADGSESVDGSGEMAPLDRKSYSGVTVPATVGAISSVEVVPKVGSGWCSSVVESKTTVDC